MPRPRIGVDFHGVIAESHEAWVRVWNRNSAHHDHGPVEDVASIASLSLRRSFLEQCPQCLRQICNHPSKDFLPVVGAIDTLRSIGLFADIFVVTASPDHMAGDISQWLFRYRIPTWGVYTTMDKAAMSDKLHLGYLIDDNYDNLARLPEKTRGYLLKRPWNKHEKGAVSFESWKEAGEYFYLSYQYNIHPDLYRSVARPKNQWQLGGLDYAPANWGSYIVNDSTTFFEELP